MFNFGAALHEKGQCFTQILNAQCKALQDHETPHLPSQVVEFSSLALEIHGIHMDLYVWQASHPVIQNASSTVDEMCFC